MLDMFSGGIKSKEEILEEIIKQIEDNEQRTRPKQSDTVSDGNKRKPDSRTTDGGQSTDDGRRSEEASQRTGSADAERNNEEIKPIGKGVFGNIYDQFRGKVKEAVDFLLKHKEGDLLGVFHREEIGDIDLVWGDTKAGLRHIFEKHIIKQNDFNNIDEMIDAMDDVISKGKIRKEDNQYVIEKDNNRVVIAETENKNFVVTAYDFIRSVQEKKRNNATESVFGQQTTKSGSSPMYDDNVSVGKDTTKNETTQETKEIKQQIVGKSFKKVSPSSVIEGSTDTFTEYLDIRHSLGEDKYLVDKIVVKNFAPTIDKKGKEVKYDRLESVSPIVMTFDEIKEWLLDAEQVSIKSNINKWSGERKIKEVKLKESEKILIPKQHKATDVVAEPENERKGMLGAVLDVLRKAIGKENVITDSEEAKRVIDEYNGEDVKYMGSRVEARMRQIDKDLVGKSLNSKQQAIVDVFTGKKNNDVIEFKNNDNSHRIVIRQGNENNAGTKHAIFRHYATTSNSFTSDDVLKISYILEKGKIEKKKRGSTTLYEYTLTEKDGTTYTVVTEVDERREVFADFYTNRKTPSAARKTRSEEARALPDSVSDGKDTINSETDKINIQFFKTSGGEVFGFTVNGKIYIDTERAKADTPIHEYTHLWAEALRKVNPKAWEQLKKEMLKQTELMDYVRSNYPEIENEDALIEEVFAHYSGTQGRKRLLEEMNKEKDKHDRAIDKIKVINMFNRLKGLLDRFWNMTKDLFAGKVAGIEKMTAEDFANMTLSSLLNKFNAVKVLQEVTAKNTKRFGQEKEDTDIRYHISKRNSEQIEKLLRNNANITDKEIEAFKQYVEHEQPVAQLSMAKWVGNGSIRLPEDKPTVDEALKICRKDKIDPMRYAAPGEIVKEWRDKNIEEQEEQREYLSPDSYPNVLTNKQDLGHGITVYDIANTKEGQQAVRDLMNDHLTVDGRYYNCWCLLYASESTGILSPQAWNYWNNYNGTQKKVAFKDGKIVSFCASSGSRSEWWDLSDKSHGEKIPVEGKIPNDKLGRSSLMEVDAKTGKAKPVGNKYKGNKKNGLYREWNEEDVLVVSENYKDGKLNGLYERWYDNGQMEVRSNYKDGKLNGLREYWYYNGQMGERANYKDGELNGLYEMWHDNGQMEVRSNYKDGKLNGLREYWYYNGQMGERANYKDGELNGLYEMWHDNGQMEVRSNYKDGKLNGLREYWYYNGQMGERANYKDGELNGLYERWHDNGQMGERENYKDGNVIEHLPLTDDKGTPAPRWEDENILKEDRAAKNIAEPENERKGMLGAVLDALRKAIGEENVITDSEEAKRVIDEYNSRVRPERVIEESKERAERVKDDFDLRRELKEITGAEGYGTNTAYVRGTSQDGTTYEVRVGNHVANFENFDRNNEELPQKIVSIVVMDEKFDKKTARYKSSEEINRELEEKNIDSEFQQIIIDDVKNKSQEEIQQAIEDVLFGMQVLKERGRLLFDSESAISYSKVQKNILETASVSNSKKHQPTVVSSNDGAKILQNLDTLATDFEKLSNQTKYFIGELAKAIGAKRYGSKSEYATFETKNGKIVTIRLADHNAKVSGFDHNDHSNGISVVISAKENKGITNDGNAHIVEYYYDANHKGTGCLIRG